MHLLLVKSSAAALLFSLACGGGLAPLFLAQKQGDERPMDSNGPSAVNAFAGGVLLAAALVHMLPDAMSETEQAGTRFIAAVNPSSSGSFPIAAAVAGFSFLSLALLEASVMRVMSLRHAVAVAKETRVSLLPEGDRTSVDSKGHPCCTAHRLSRAASGTMTMTLSATSESPASALALVMALAVHSLLEGVGIGAQASSATVGTVLVATAAHKSMAAFALGSQLRRYCTDSAVIVAIVIFALCSPVGIVVGSFLLKAFSGFGVGLVLSVASGTFLFVAIPEMLVPAWEDGGADKNRVMVVLVAIVGFVGMSTLAVWT